MNIIKIFQNTEGRWERLPSLTYFKLTDFNVILATKKPQYRIFSF